MAYKRKTGPKTSRVIFNLDPQVYVAIEVKDEKEAAKIIAQYDEARSTGEVDLAFGLKRIRLARVACVSFIEATA